MLTSQVLFGQALPTTDWLPIQIWMCPAVASPVPAE